MSDLVKTFDFYGAAVTTYVFRGRECWIAQDVARVIGYETGWKASWKRWVDGDELLAGKDYATLKGEELREFKAVLDGGSKSELAKTTQLTVVYETGLNAVCLLTDKPLGKKLRRFVAEKVLPDLRRRVEDAEELRDRYVALSLRLQPHEAETIWERETVQDICRLYRKDIWDGTGRMPMWLREPMGRIYRVVLGNDVYRALKRRNPDPKDGSLNYQFLTEARHKLMLKDMGVVSAFLQTSHTVEEFFGRLAYRYGRKPFQLGWA